MQTQPVNRGLTRAPGALGPQIPVRLETQGTLSGKEKVVSHLSPENRAKRGPAAPVPLSNPVPSPCPQAGDRPCLSPPHPPAPKQVTTSQHPYATPLRQAGPQRRKEERREESHLGEAPSAPSGARGWRPTGSP